VRLAKSEAESFLARLLGPLVLANHQAEEYLSTHYTGELSIRNLKWMHELLQKNSAR
jgi:hypothetical protein